MPSDMFESIKAQLDGKSKEIDQDIKRYRDAIAMLKKGYEEIVSIPGSEAEVGLRLAKKISESFVGFDIDDAY